MKKFKHGARVFVARDMDGGDIGIAGQVVRLMRSNHGAWVKLDKRHPRCPFPSTDLTRSTHVQALPEDCKPAPGAPETDER